MDEEAAREAVIAGTYCLLFSSASPFVTTMYRTSTPLPVVAPWTRRGGRRAGRC